MRYPVLPRSSAAEIAVARARGEDVFLSPYVSWLGTGPDVDLAQLSEVGGLIARSLDAGGGDEKDRDRVEGSYSPALYEACRDVPAEALNDPGFWRYLALEYFWPFIAWRESGPISNGNVEKYVSAESPTESVLTRMYMRGSAVGGSEHAELASALDKATDFWRSHVLRVRTGTSPPVTRALVRSQRANRLQTDDLREFARNLNRMWTNLLPQMYDDQQAGDLIEEVRSWTDPER